MQHTARGFFAPPFRDVLVHPGLHPFDGQRRLFPEVPRSCIHWLVEVPHMVTGFIVAAWLIALGSWPFVSNATSGVAGLWFACFMAIAARIAQASSPW